MKELQFLKKVFSYYFTLTFIATSFLVVFCQFEFEILFNFTENCLFAILILVPSNFILNTRIRCFYDLLVFTGFSLTVLFESIYYLLFQVFFSASSVFNDGL
jgi:heptose-I-phosphate ethanolaminephosphotransferase